MWHVPRLRVSPPVVNILFSFHGVQVSFTSVLRYLRLCSSRSQSALPAARGHSLGDTAVLMTPEEAAGAPTRPAVPSARAQPARTGRNAERGAAGGRGAQTPRPGAAGWAEWRGCSPARSPELGQVEGRRQAPVPAAAVSGALRGSAAAACPACGFPNTETFTST